MRIEKYLEEVMNSQNLRKDKELADWLGVTASAVSQYRKGTRTMSNEQCVMIALELGIDPLKVIMATDLDKAERAGQKSLWEVFSQRTATAASVALFLGAVTLFLTPDNAQAAPALNSIHTNNVAGFTLC
jgi:DNA-binding transcriptional regulator YdaS (Cro superfamily)